MTLIFFPVKAEISYFSNISKPEPKPEPPISNFCLNEKLSFRILLHFWVYILVWELLGLRFGLRLCMSKCAYEFVCSIQSSNVTFWILCKPVGQKTWIFWLFALTSEVEAILGAPEWAPVFQKCYHLKLQTKMKIFMYYYFFWKCTRFSVQTHFLK